MSIRIIRKNEKNVYRWDDTEIYYRRVSSSVSSKINEEHKKRGVIDVTAAGMATLEWAITGWKGVLDENDQEIPFDPELIKDLPDEILLEIANRLREASPERVQLSNLSDISQD